MTYFDDDDRLDYPTADTVVAEYLRVHGDRERTTSVDVLAWSEYPNSHHNRQRVFDALGRVCTETDANWAGRTVFEIPADIDNL